MCIRDSINAEYGSTVFPKLMVGVYSTPFFAHPSTVREHDRTYMRQHCFNHSERLYSEDSSKLDQGDTGHMVWGRDLQARASAESRTHLSDSSLPNHLVGTAPGSAHDTPRESRYWLFRPEGEPKHTDSMAAAIHERDPPYRRTGGTAPGGAPGIATRSAIGAALQLRGQLDVWSDDLQGAHESAARELRERELSDPARGVKPYPLRLHEPRPANDIQAKANLQFAGWTMRRDHDGRDEEAAYTSTTVVSPTKKWGYGDHYTVDRYTTTGVHDKSADDKSHAVRATQQELAREQQQRYRRWRADRCTPHEQPWRAYGRDHHVSLGTFSERFDPSHQTIPGTTVEDAALAVSDRVFA
eukprot:TRINITY_DN17236_c0_g1_i2.p1 TRINITY_DN17236_c0_g1~~TRINITY_DN17236_c0_g1_i2.p1  ORF type:complete len:356 (+),score=68.03 TRINITY_DN17236_c0_g1_i2:148-1215(+)